MSEIVFILGAGASKDAGAPLMIDFLDKAHELLRGGKLGEYAEDFERVFDARSKLQIALSKAELDLDNIESVFAALEMGRLINRLPEIPKDDIALLLSSIRRLILKTLENTIKYPIRDETMWPDHAYNQFALLVKDLVTKGHACSIITFNYDYALDYALNFNGIPADYCLPQTTQGGVIPLLKLHGSLNWASCSKCDEIIPFELSTYLSQSNASLAARIRKGHLHMNVGASLPKSNLKHCQQAVKPDPVIVPPTWNKTEYHQVLSQVWSRAASELSTAESIFISGYSLSETDLFFRYLFALGAIGRTMIKRFWVFDIDRSGIVSSRFQKLAGLSTRARYQYVEATFAQATDIIRKEILR
jgi:NAD-dependent SIR2 family protein deacetylase